MENVLTKASGFTGTACWDRTTEAEPNVVQLRDKQMIVNN